MKLQVNRVAHPVTVLGPGRRLGVWVQGCHIGCAGCGSIDTWDPCGGQALDTETLAPDLAEIIVSDRLTGLTLTGGEPTEQADALADLVRRIRAILDAQADPWELDVLVFTGRTARAAQRSAGALWAVADVAICGPYRADKPSTVPLVATSNQVMVTLTDLGAARFGGSDQATGAFLQTHVADGEITLIGLPGPGDLPRIEEALEARGISMQGRSWQTP